MAKNAGPIEIFLDHYEDIGEWEVSIHNRDKDTIEQLGNFDTWQEALEAITKHLESITGETR